MRKIYLSLLILTGLFLNINAEAQIKIGTNGATISPASLLELESNNQGLLIPRMATTTAIDGLNPPIGMMVYITTEPSGIYIKKAAGWEYLTGFLGGVANFNSITVTGAVTAGSFSGPLTGNATTATTALNATNSANSTVTNDISNPAVTYPVFVNSTPGNQPLRTSSGNLSYIPATGILTARGFAGPLTGDVTGNATSAVDAQNTVNLRITNDLVTPTTMYPTFVGGTSGPLPARVSSTRLSFIPLTGELTAPIFRGNLLGNATSATTVTGVVNAPNGGTGQTIYTPGDILYADASNTLAKLPIGVTGTILRVDASNRPSWSTAGAGTVTNVTGVANRISVVDPTVAPVIDIDVNYTGQASINTLGTVITGTWNAGVIPSTYGGTGVATLTTNELLVGGGAGNPIGSISLIGSAGKVLTSNGVNALPTFETAGIGDMVLSVDQTVNGIKRFNDGTLILKGSGTGITTLRSDANTNGSITLPSGTRTLVSLDGNEILVNKTLTAPNMTGTANFQTLSGTQLILGGGTALATTNQTGTAGSIVLSNGPTVVNPIFTGLVTAGAITSNGVITATLFDGPASTANNTGTGATLRSAASIATAVDRANGATDANTAGRIVMRDASGDFSANVITATLAGNATNVTGTVAIVNGGTGQTTAITGFNALSPMIAQGDLIYGGVAGTGTRLPIGSSTQVLKGGLTTPVWGSVVLTTDVSNVLPPANGGTGVANTNSITLTGANIALTATGATAITLPTTGTLATLAGTEALTNKTVNGTTFTGTGGTLSLASGNVFTTVGANPITLTSAGGGSILTLPGSGTLATLAGVEALTNKTINGNAITNGTGTLTLAAGAAFTTSGGPITLNSANPSNVTLPATGILVAAISGSENLTFGNTLAGASQDIPFTVAFTGAVDSDPVSLGVPAALMTQGGIYTAWVSGPNTVTVRFTNTTAAPIDPNPGIFSAKVLK